MIELVDYTDNAQQGCDDIKNNWSYDKCTPDPNGPWSIGHDGIYIGRQTKDSITFTKITGQPIYIRDRVIDLDTGDTYITLVWEDGLRLCDCTVPKKTISSSGKILALANRGYAIHTGNARQIVQYLADLMDYQQANIPIKYMVSSCGSKLVDGTQVFMVGNHAVCGTENAPDVSFNASINDCGIVSKLRSSKEGELSAWVEMAHEIGEYPIAAFGVMAAFLPPLLKDLEVAQNPIIDYGGKTSTGKSTTLIFAASVFGNPAESDNGLVRSWSGTDTFFERYGHVMNELPIFLDESHITNPREIRNILYQYANGTGRGRGSISGMQANAKYRGVLFSAGESRLADMISNGGVQARVIGFAGSPFGTGKRKLVENIYKVAIKHYGLAGRRVLKEYLQNRDEFLPQLRLSQKEMTDHLAGLLHDDVGRRLSKYFGAIYAAGVLADYVLDLRWDVRSIVIEAFKSAVSNRPASMAQEAIELVGEWIAGNRAKFETADTDSVPAELYGRIFNERESGEERIALLPNALRALLTQHGYSYSSVIDQWRESGWLSTDDGRAKKKVRLNGTPIYMIVLNQSGIATSRGGSDADIDA